MAAHVFPSVEWFQALADIAKQDEAYKKFGRLNAVVGFKIGGRQFSANFDVLDIHDIREIEEDDLRDADFVIDMSPDLWKEMLEDIKANGHATLDHTLNTLDLKFDDPIHKNLMEDGYKADMFFRYNPSLQRFFDNAAQVETKYDEALVSA